MFKPTLFAWAPSLPRAACQCPEMGNSLHLPVQGGDAFKVSSCSCCSVAGLALSLRTSPHFPFCVHPHNLSVIHARNISESHNSPALYPGLHSLLAHVLLKGHLPSHPHGLTPAPTYHRYHPPTPGLSCQFPGGSRDVSGVLAT